MTRKSLAAVFMSSPSVVDLAIQRMRLGDPNLIQGRGLLSWKWRVREEDIQAFCHRWMREDRVAQRCIRKSGQHSRLHDRDHFAGLGPQHREAENAVGAGIEEDFHKAPHLAKRARAQD